MSTTSSRGTYVVFEAATLMAPDFSAWLRQAAARVLERHADELVIAPGGLRWGHANGDDLAIRHARHPLRRSNCRLPLRLRISQYRNAGGQRPIHLPVAVDRATGECETSITLTQDRSCRRAAASPTAPGVRDEPSCRDGARYCSLRAACRSYRSDHVRLTDR
jgi:hypothetical protein